MPVYAIVNRLMVEFDDNCSFCGIASISGTRVNDSDVEAFEAAELDENHMRVEITNEERMNLVKREYVVEREGKVFKTLDPADLDYFEREAAASVPVFKIDPGRAEGKIEDREKVEVPIEIDGPNGKEIIGYEQKPVSIVIERDKSEKQPGS